MINIKLVLKGKHVSFSNSVLHESITES